MKYYLTTAIAYPNAQPHLGHALEIVQADVIARFQRLKGKQVFFQTGTDEHGIKNWTTAKKQGKEIKKFLDENVASYKQLYTQLNISYDNFIRTTDLEKHHPGAKKLWQQLVAAGDIYKQTYKGLYCTGCEVFKTEKELVDNKCPEHPTRELEIIEEENYFFRLSKYKEHVAELIRSDQYHVIPEQRKNEILAFLKEANDISFSRTKEALPWGIPVPSDEAHTMYVWCDALSNYITGIGYGRDEDNFNKWWPADCHIVGKDIIRFHAAFWPAMLLSAKLPLPKQLFVHGFILSHGTKMSKSTGNIIEPFSQIEKYGTDPFRFHLLDAMPIDADGDYSETTLLERYNTELVGNLSNFCYRTLSFIEKNYDSKLSTSDTNEQLQQEIAARTKKALDLTENYEFRQAIQEILHIAQAGNAYMQAAAPWKNKEQSQPVLTTCANILKDLSILLAPYMPSFSQQLQQQLNLSNQTHTNLGFNVEHHAINKPAIIFAKKERASIAGFAVIASPLKLITAKITKVERHPDAEKLYIEHLDDGSGKPRQIVSGLVPYYTEKELQGKTIILVDNLKPAKLRGIESQGMLLAADKNDIVEVLEVAAPPGAPITIGNGPSSNEQLTFDQFQKLKLRVREHNVFCNEQPIQYNGQQLTTKLENGKVR